MLNSVSDGEGASAPSPKSNKVRAKRASALEMGPLECI